MLLVLGTASCTSPTVLFVNVSSGDAASATLTAATVSLFDSNGLLARRTVQAANYRAGSPCTACPDRAEPVRVAVVGEGGADPVLGATAVVLAPHAEVTANVVLKADLADSDGDGVPDSIDDCPSTPDADQQNTSGSGPGDACRSGDLGAQPRRSRRIRSRYRRCRRSRLRHGLPTSIPAPAPPAPSSATATAAPSCVPTVTTQGCYSGAANTAGVGVCRSGTQSCIGALGPCNVARCSRADRAASTASTTTLRRHRQQRQIGITAGPRER